MAKDEKNRDRAADDRHGFGDDQGTRIGSPTPGDDRGAAHADGGAAQRPRGDESTGPRTPSTGAGAEAAEGIHSADGDREPEDRSSLEGKPTGRGRDRDAHRSGSEPIDSHDRERSSGYGGEMGEPKDGA